MEAFKYHVYVCDQKKPEGIPCCSAHGSARILELLRAEVAAQGLSGDVQITTSGSIGLCERGPNMIVYPEGIWYSAVTPDDVSEIVIEHFKNGHPVRRLVNTDQKALRAEVELNKSKMLAGMKARDESGMLPDDLMTLFNGFRASRIMLTAIELDLFTAVRDGATAADVASRLGTDRRATEALLNAITSLGILEKKGTQYTNSAAAARYLAEGGKNDSRMGIMHAVHLWNRWSTLTECIRKGTSVTYTEMTTRDDKWTQAFIAAMDANARARGRQVAGIVDASGVKKLLDVGGGSGAYSIAFAKANPELQGFIFDLPTVVPIAQKHIEEAGLKDRIKFIEGDMRTDEFGTGFDMVFVSAICHMFDDQENLSLFQKVQRALNPGGRIVIQDFILNDDKTGPVTAALFSINMLVGTPHGASYSEAEYTDWLKKTGFEQVRRVTLPGPTDLIVATKS
jgi:(2Fe-2S) ferredoxin/ubiquinone/menaquinone biosynthesis C-methylase UbiE